MRKAALVLVCLFVSMSLLAQQPAQQPEKRNHLYVFVSNPHGGWSEGGGSSVNGAVGVAFQHMFTQRWSGELAIARQRDHSGFTRFDPNGNVIERQEFDIDTTPIDLSAHYHFLNNIAWKPYLGVGARYTDGDQGPFTDPGNQFNFGANGGVIWQIRPAFGLRFDGKILFGDTGRLDRLNASAGLVWAF